MVGRLLPREVTGSNRYLLKRWYFVAPTQLGFQGYQVDTIMLVLLMLWFAREFTSLTNHNPPLLKRCNSKRVSLCYKRDNKGHMEGNIVVYQWGTNVYEPSVRGGNEATHWEPKMRCTRSFLSWRPLMNTSGGKCDIKLKTTKMITRPSKNKVGWTERIVWKSFIQIKWIPFTAMIGE